MIERKEEMKDFEFYKNTKVYIKLMTCGNYDVADVYLMNGVYLGDVWSKKRMTVEKWYQGGYVVYVSKTKKASFKAMIRGEIVKDYRDGGNVLYD